MRHQTPIEIRKALGKRTRKNLAEIPEGYKSNLPIYEWIKDPAAFNRSAFINETAEFMERVYGIRTGHEALLMMLASEMQTYVEAMKGFEDCGRQLIVNERPSVWIKIRDKAAENIIRLQRELGLTPSSRLEAPAVAPQDKALADFLNFPKLLKTKQDT